MTPSRVANSITISFRMASHLPPRRSAPCRPLTLHTNGPGPNRQHREDLSQAGPLGDPRLQTSRPASGRYAGSCAHPLEYRGEALTAADAHGFQAVAGVTAVHLAGHGGQDAGASGADGVAEGYAGPVHVEPVEVRLAEAPFPGAGEHLRGEG